MSWNVISVQARLRQANCKSHKRTQLFAGAIEARSLRRAGLSLFQLRGVNSRYSAPGSRVVELADMGVDGVMTDRLNVNQVLRASERMT